MHELSSNPSIWQQDFIMKKTPTRHIVIKELNPSHMCYMTIQQMKCYILSFSCQNMLKKSLMKNFIFYAVKGYKHKKGYITF